LIATMIILDNDLEPSAGCPAGAAMQQNGGWGHHRMTRRTSHDRAIERRCSRCGSPPSRGSERNNPLPGESAPETGIVLERWPVAPGQDCYEPGIAGEQVHGAGGAFPDKAADHKSRRVHPGITGDAH
jgi:hypothetical protein